MSPLQKQIILKLLSGYNIVGNPNYGYRLRSPQQVVCRKFSHATFVVFKDLLRVQRGVYYINKNLVRQLHGRSWVKQQYKTKAYTAISSTIIHQMSTNGKATATTGARKLIQRLAPTTERVAQPQLDLFGS